MNNYSLNQTPDMNPGNIIINQANSPENQTIDTQRSFTTPPQQTFSGEQMKGSMQKILSDNLGEYVVAEFLIGTDTLMRKQGVLYSVGTSYVTLYDDINNNFIVCDIFSIKFVYFYYPGQRPSRNFNLLPSANSNK